MFGHPLIDLWLAHERGEPAVAPDLQDVPPHLENVTWRFACTTDGCAPWKDVASAELHGTRWLAPARQCPTCRAWVTGASPHIPSD